MGVVVSLGGTKDHKPSLDALMALVEEDLKAVNEQIVGRMASPVSLIPQLAGHIIAAGGKRLRPILTLAASRLCGYAGRRHILLAACIEFIHTATLLHDDVVDDSDLEQDPPDSSNELSLLADWRIVCLLMAEGVRVVS